MPKGVFDRSKKREHPVIDGVAGKICRTCSLFKPLNEYFKAGGNWDGLCNECKSCTLTRNKSRYNANKEQIAESGKIYYQDNKELILARNRNWVSNHKESNNQYKSEWQHAHKDERQAKLKARYHSDLQYRIAVLLRTRINRAIRNGQKKGSTLDLLGCTVEYFMQYIATKFTADMSWDNWGAYWHIDHIKPCAVFDLNDAEQMKDCFHHTNMQPLLAKDNLVKGDRWVG